MIREQSKTVVYKEINTVMLPVAVNAGARPIIMPKRSALTESEVLLTAKHDSSHNCWVIHPRPFVIISEMPLSLSTPFNLSQLATCPLVTAAIRNANLSAFLHQI